MKSSVDFRRRNYYRNVLLGNVCKEMEISRVIFAKKRTSMEYLKMELL